MVEAEKLYISSSLQVVTLDADLSGKDGSLLAPKGSKVQLSPQALDIPVITEDGRNLRQTLNAMREALAGYQTELICLASKFAEVKLTAMELNNGDS